MSGCKSSVLYIISDNEKVFIKLSLIWEFTLHRRNVSCDRYNPYFFYTRVYICIHVYTLVRLYTVVHWCTLVYTYNVYSILVYTCLHVYYKYYLQRDYIFNILTQQYTHCTVVYSTSGVANLWPAGQKWPFLNSGEHFHFWPTYHKRLVTPALHVQCTMYTSVQCTTGYTFVSGIFI